MRTLVLLGLLTLAVARPARAESPEPDEPPIELGPPPAPPPGARVTEPEEPSAPAPPPPPEVGDLPPSPPAPTPHEPDAPSMSLGPSPNSPPTQKAEPDPPSLAPSDSGGAAGRRKPLAWYGWKILIADGGALVLAVSSQPFGTILGTGAFVLTAPSIHLGHRRPLAALGSLSLRIAAPLALNALIKGQPCSGDLCIQPGVLAGALLASVVDVSLLAHDDRDSKPKKAERIAPAVAAGPKGTALFLTGSF